MSKQVIMPQLGESVVEGTLTKWLKAPGERVEEFEPLLEINTDKVDTEVPSPAAGVVLELRFPEGSLVQAGAVLAVIGEAYEIIESRREKSDTVEMVEVAEEISTLRSLPANATSAKPDEGLPGSSRETGFISPLVKRLADEYNLDLRLVPGSGLGGRITKADVLTYLQNRVASQTSVGTAPHSGSPASERAVTPIPNYHPINLPGDELLPLSTVRRSIAEHMVFSERTSPHVTTVMEVDLSRVVAHRQANKDSFARDGANLTFTAYFVAAVTTALKAYPIVNSTWTEKGILVHHMVNIGIATALDDGGLIVPVIKNAEGMSLLGLARLINDLAERARARQLKPDEVKGGTFTITNHGVSGSLFATPIINQPQSAILGVGAIQKRVIAATDANGLDVMAIRPMAYLSLTFDHRVLDGALADAFLGKVVELLKIWQ